MKKPTFILLSFVTLAFCSCANPLMDSILQPKTITFDSNGGSHVPSQTLLKNEKISVPRAPSKPGYFFGGWFIDNTHFNNSWNFDDIPEWDMTLYAEWHLGKPPTEKEFSIIGTGFFVYDGNPKAVKVTPLGGIIVGEITVYYEGIDNSYSKQPNAPANPGTYNVTFNVAGADGWNAVKDLQAGTLFIETPFINNSDELRIFLKKLSSSTVAGENGASPSNPLTIPLNIYNSNELKNISNALKSAPGIYVTLDLSGSHILEIPEMAFTSYIGSNEPANDNTPDNYIGCNTLTGIILPYIIDRIGFAAFANCKNLNDVDMKNNISEIGAGAFAWCEGLTDINIPNSVNSIGSAAFYGCTGLIYVNIPDNVTNIEESTFDGCSSLNNINIPCNVTTIGSHAFYGCSNLTIVIFEGIIEQNNFNASAFGSPTETGYIGDLREKYFSAGTSGSTGGKPGIYKRENNQYTWTKD